LSALRAKHQGMGRVLNLHSLFWIWISFLHGL
jgi:hypothetical protein